MFISGFLINFKTRDKCAERETWDNVFCLMYLKQNIACRTRLLLDLNLIFDARFIVGTNYWP